ncbi:MAG TPA: hypothetical protein VF897_23485 [Roseiflexaceae bacterium]
MHAVIIMAASFGAAYLGRPPSARRSLALADLAIGLVGGLISLSIVQRLDAAGATWDLGMPLLFACALTLGLQSLRLRTP